MYNIKKQIFLNFDKTQKTALCNYLRAFVKQKFQLDINDILDLFIEDEKYYLKINNSRFPYLKDVIDDNVFISDSKKYIEECKNYYLYKERQRPLLESKKQYDRQKKKFLLEIKMSKETPTKKQIYYYGKLCDKYSIEKHDINKMSKLDIKNEIERIINEHTESYKFDD